MNREKVRMLIELSENVEQADSVVTEQGFSTIKEKIAYIKGMFDTKLIGRFDDESISIEEQDKADYYALLSAIINEKWEA